VTIELEIIRVISAYMFIVILFFGLRKRGIGRERLLIVATIRMTVQLILTGYLLIYLFDNPHPLWTLLVILVMVLFAIYTIFKKFSGELSRKLKRVIAVSLPLGGLPVLIFFLLYLNVIFGSLWEPFIALSTEISSFSVSFLPDFW